jgi:hypothetical protein
MKFQLMNSLRAFARAYPFLTLDFDQSMYAEQHVFQISDRIYRLNFINKESGLSAPFTLNMNPIEPSRRWSGRSMKFSESLHACFANQAGTGCQPL